jgi:hypothetical protein
MLRHLLKLTWKRKSRNLMLSLEILLAFAIVFGIAAFGLRYWQLYRMPIGFDGADTWSVKMVGATSPTRRFRRRLRHAAPQPARTARSARGRLCGLRPTRCRPWTHPLQVAADRRRRGHRTSSNPATAWPRRARHQADRGPLVQHAGRRPARAAGGAEPAHGRRDVPRPPALGQQFTDGAHRRKEPCAPTAWSAWSRTSATRAS